MCASIHLSFKMEALKTASPTQGRLGPVRSNRTYTYRKKKNQSRIIPFIKPFLQGFNESLQDLQDDQSFVALQ